MTMDSRSISWLLSDDLVWEVLVHLPTKSLMRFKCVSKLWYSIILNPNFAKRYSQNAGCFHGILLSQFLSNPYQSLDNPKRLSYLNINDSNNPRLMNCHQLTLEVPDYVASTAIVKGLIGLYKYSSFALYNIATHEMVKLPTSPPCSVYKYHLGFDPINEVFKVLKICDNGIRVNSFIFTVAKGSGQTWRRIDNLGRINYATCVRSRCINGTLYWIFSKENTFLLDSYFLTTFHLNSETFETIPLVTIQRPGDGICYFDHLAEISGSPALITFTLDYDDVKVDVWLMKNGSLTKQTPLWPKSVEWTGCRLLEIPRSLAYATTLPTGEILFARKYPSVVLLKYDHIKNEFGEFKLNGYYPSRFRNDHMGTSWKEICYHEDNIIALGPLMNK